MKAFILLFLVAFIVCDFSSKKYLLQSAGVKMNQLWGKITENQTPLGFYSSLRVATMFAEGMKQSFDWEGDEMLDGRKKLIHTVGTVGKTEFISNNSHSYTGIFRGCENVLLRPSIAKDQDTSKSSAEQAHDNFVPGMAIKFLRDGFSSANLQAMYALDGQNSWNFFKNDFSNHVEAVKTFSFRLLGLKFSSATDYIQTMGLRDLAHIGCNGEIDDHPKYPFKLIFKPNSVLRNQYPDHFEKDYLDQLKAVTVGSTIYDVYAVDQPESEPKLIGSLKTTSNMVTSHWGDELLFFRHNYMDYDLVENPQWEKYVPKYSFFEMVAHSIKISYYKKH